MTISEWKGQELTRKRHVPAEYRTDGKDEAADWLEEHVINAGRWPMDLSDIADEAGWARQHMANTLRDYFEPAGGDLRIDRPDGGAAGTVSIEIDVPPEDDADAYLRGYLRGWLDAQEQRRR